MKYVFYGSIETPAGQLDHAAVRIAVSPGVDYPGGSLVVDINSEAVVAEFETAEALTLAGLATMRNFAGGTATTLIRCYATVEGMWAIARIDRAEGPGGRTYNFDPVHQPLQQQFARYGITAMDVIRVTEQPGGFYLRNAIDNISNGLREPKFARAQFYCAVEALRTSMAPNADRGQQWPLFRAELKITESQTESLRDHALRHGDYANAIPLSSDEMEAALALMGEIVCKYVAWFKREKMPIPAPAAPQTE